jgi:hypothetical protein
MDKTDINIGEELTKLLADTVEFEERIAKDLSQLRMQNRDLWARVEKKDSVTIVDQGVLAMRGSDRIRDGKALLTIRAQDCTQDVQLWLSGPALLRLQSEIGIAYSKLQRVIDDGKNPTK